MLEDFNALIQVLLPVILSTKMGKYLYLLIGKIAHVKGMNPSVEDVRGGEYEPPSSWGGGGMGGSLELFRMQESASETIFQRKNNENFAVK